jgi:hypothetical protein
LNCLALTKIIIVIDTLKVRIKHNKVVFKRDYLIFFVLIFINKFGRFEKNLYLCTQETKKSQHNG